MGHGQNMDMDVGYEHADVRIAYKVGDGDTMERRERHIQTVTHNFLNWIRYNFQTRINLLVTYIRKEDSDVVGQNVANRQLSFGLGTKFLLFCYSM